MVACYVRTKALQKIENFIQHAVGTQQKKESCLIIIRVIDCCRIVIQIVQELQKIYVWMPNGNFGMRHNRS